MPSSDTVKRTSVGNSTALVALPAPPHPASRCLRAQGHLRDRHARHRWGDGRRGL